MAFITFPDRQVNAQTGTIEIVGEFPNSRNLLALVQVYQSLGGGWQQ
jgi:hypothetical protein